MSEQNPPDEEDSGYTSKNRTESLPTTGSVPDISAVELSSQSSENHINVKQDENDSENKKLKEGENSGPQGLDESVIAGSTQSRFPTTPQTSNAELSPLMTSTPVRAGTPKEKDVQNTKGKEGTTNKMKRPSGLENTELEGKDQRIRDKTAPNEEEGKDLSNPGQNSPIDNEEKNLGISGRNSPNKEEKNQDTSKQNFQSKEAKDPETLNKSLPSNEKKKERTIAGQSPSIHQKKGQGALEKVLPSEKEKDRPPNIMAARALKPKMPKGSKWSTALKLQEPKRTKKQSSPLWKIFLGSLGSSIINIEDTGSAVDSVIKKPTTSPLAKSSSPKNSPSSSETAEVSKAESTEETSPTEETEQSESVTEAPSPTKETEQSESVTESEEAPSPTEETEQSESVTESTEAPSPTEETEQSESVTESTEAPSPTEETEQSESVTETPSPTEETEQSESVTESTEAPSPTEETEQSESVIEAPSPITETEQSENVTEAPSPTTETEQSESVIEAPSPTTETERSESVTESEEAPSPSEEMEQSESVTEAPSPTTETERSESVLETATVKETGNLEDTEKETNETDPLVIEIRNEEKTESSTEIPDPETNDRPLKTDDNAYLETSSTSEPGKEIIEEIAYEVPEELKKYIDSATAEWQDPKTRKVIFQTAVQNHYIDSGTKFETPDTCMWKPPKDLLIATYTKRDSLKTGAVHAPAENLAVPKGDLWKTMIKQSAEEGVPVSVVENRKPSRPETGYLRRRSSASVGSFSGSVDPELISSKIGQGKCHSTLILPEIEKGEADIVFSRRRKSDLGFCKHYTMTPSKLALEDSMLHRRYKSLPDLNEGKPERDTKLKEGNNTEGEKSQQNSEHEAHREKIPPDVEQKGSPLMINKHVTEDHERDSVSSDEPQNQGSKHKIDITDTIDAENANKSPSPNLELEAITTMLKEKLDEQSAALKRQNLVTGILLQSLNRGKLLDDETFKSLCGGDIIDLENVTLKNIAMVERNEENEEMVTENNKSESNEKSPPITPQSHRNVDPSSPSEVLKRKLEKEIEDKVFAEKNARSIPSRGYKSGADLNVTAENDICQYTDTSSETEEKQEMNVIGDLYPSATILQSATEMSNNQELEIPIPSGLVYDKCFTGSRRFSGMSSGKSHPNMDDCDEEIISHYTHEGSSSKLLQRRSSDHSIYEMGSNLQLCNLIAQPSKENLEQEDPVKEIDVEPAVVMSCLKDPKVGVVKDVRFENSLLYLESPVFPESAASSVVTFPHRDSLLITDNPSYSALLENVIEFQHESEENLQLPLKRASSVWDFLKLLYTRDPEFVRQSLDRAECGDKTVEQLLSLFSDADNEDTNVDDVSESPRKRSLPSVSPRSMTPEARSWLMEKEVLENQTRKLQLEVSSLHAENNAIKERLNRAQGTVESLEDEIANKNEEVETAHLTLQQQTIEVENKVKEEMSRENDRLQSQNQSLHQENEDLKTEVSALEQRLDAAERANSQIKLSVEKTKTLEASKMEILTLKEEVGRVKALLEQSENHLHEEEVRSKELSQQVLRLTEMKNLLQQQIDKGGGGTTSDKQIKSLEKRLKITEERLHQERADRANNLSEVEDKLLTENARLQAVEKELNRQLQREKDKNRNLDNKVKDTREEVEKLRLALPFDESTLTSGKREEYDIPYSIHSNQRHENKKTPDYKYVLGQVEQQSGLTSGQEKEVICHLWSTRETTYQQLRHLQFILQDLKLPDNDLTAGLKQLRDLKSQYEDRLQHCEEKVQDSQSQLATFETTYKEQLNALVKEKHEFFARLKTTEDLLEALKGENEILKSNITGSVGPYSSSNRDSQIEALNIEIKNLENKTHHLKTSNQILEGEVNTLRVQLEAKEKALEDAQTEAHLATSRLGNTEAIERRQQRIDKLTAEIQNLQTEMRVLSEKNNSLITEKKHSDSDLSNCQREINMLKSRQKDSKAVDLTDNKFVQSLKEELQQKDMQLSQTTRELQTLESELQHTRHTMYSEQAHMANLQAQVDSLKNRLEEKNSILDTISRTNSDSQSHDNSLKETLESMSQELALVQAHNKTLDSEVNRERTRCEMLQEDLSRAGGRTDSREQSSLELQVKQLEEERKRLQEQLVEAGRNGEELTQNMIDTQSESQRLQQDLSSEQAKLLHMSAQKGELEQHLEEIAEEHDALIQEKSQSEEDLVKLEKKLQEIVQMFEMDALRQQNNFQTHYSDIPPELRKMASELDTIRTMLDSKNGELEMLQDKLSRQNMETEFLQRRVELLQSENHCNREDIARLTGELANKIKETGSLREVNQLLLRERNKIQRQRETEEKEKMWEKTHNEKYRKEVSDIIHKLEEEKKFSSRNEMEELKTTNQRLDILSSEHEKALNSLNVEKQATAQLKADLQKCQRECEDFRGQLHVTTLELETAKAQLTARDETIESLKQDKGAFYQEYDSMCRRLTEKDEKIENLRQKCDKTVETLRQEFSQEKLNLEQERTSTESDLDKAKETNDFLNEEVKQKDAQLVTFGRTLHELEDLTKQKHELEHQVEKLEFDCSSLKQLLQNSEREVEAHQSTINRMQEIHAKLQVDKTRLTDQLKEEKASSTREIQALMKTMSDEKSHHEGEKAYLKENLSQTQSKLQALESTLASAIESRDKFHMTNRMLEHSLEETKGKLQEESTCYRVSEKKTETLQSQLNDSRRERFLTEDKLNQCQTSMVKLEKELRAEKDQGQELGERILELEALSATQQSALKSKQEQLDVLQSEIGKLRQIIDGQKQQLGGKLKKSAHEFKQQLDLVEMEKEQLSKQNQQLTFDLEKARETIQNKNKDNLKLQEDILGLEDQIRERSSKLRKVEDNLKVEEEIQTKLASRYQEQEDEVKRLKIFLTKKAEEATDADKSMWQDMSKVIQDMSLKMQQHFEGSKERENQREQDLKLIKKYKKQVRDLETDLNTEKAVHTITKSSLQALEEDCQRLRKQFMASRRRGQSSTEKPSKSRMEAINEIIARSQTQAQNMLAAGGYFDETLRSITTPRGGDYNNHNNDGSPDTSIASDFSFNSVPAVIMTTYPSQAKSPRK
ncbi:uncharacterized protein LOC125650483 [Ostrea edulis]|uniref:uncharacterized protein LOC125650483 n=1 Tax=Ostrea edulis TaxID=37623 RepID=UPI0024AEAC62|nr:uncharacterized protein LOC125650483 [Ostrea edulis]